MIDLIDIDTSKESPTTSPQPQPPLDSTEAVTITTSTTSECIAFEIEYLDEEDSDEWRDIHEPHAVTVVDHPIVVDQIPTDQNHATYPVFNRSVTANVNKKRQTKRQTLSPPKQQNQVN